MDLKDSKPVKIMTICFLVKDVCGSRKVCLAEKKRGFRTGTINGYGGKLEDGETLEDCVLREIREESRIEPKGIEKRGVIVFYDCDTTYICHVYLCDDWEGEPVETDEMDPAWYPADRIPFERMGMADSVWVPRVLAGDNIVATFRYDESGEICFQDVSSLSDCDLPR